MVILTNFGRYCKQKLLNNLSYLPRKAKRLIFVATLFRIIDSINAEDSELVEKLNVILQISRNSHAWEFPMTISSLIWNDLKSSVIQLHNSSVAIYELKTAELDEEDSKTVAAWFAKRIPEWLRYGSDELIEHDAKALITQVHKLKAY